MKIKIGIIGPGKVAHMHADALLGLKNAELCAVYGRTEAKVKSFAGKYGIKACQSIEEMIKKDGIGAVIICTPHPNHKEPAIRAISSGAHVLIEKPLAVELDDCDEIIKAAKRKGVKLGVVSQRRFFKPSQRVKDAIENGKIGKPVLGTVTMLGYRDRKYYESDPWRGSYLREGGGVLVNQAPHQLDLLLWYMGRASEVFGYHANLNHPYIEVEDTAVAVIKFENGGLGNIVVSNSQNPALYGRVHIFGENGSAVGVQTDGGAMFIAGMSSISEPPKNDLWTIKGEEHLVEEWEKADRDFFEKVDPMLHYHKLQDGDFIDSIIEDRKPLIDGNDARQTVELFRAIYDSDKLGVPVKLPLRDM